MHWRVIEPQSPEWQARILPLKHYCDKGWSRLVKEQPLKEKKKENVGALNFGGAMDHFLWEYRSVVELSIAD